MLTNIKNVFAKFKDNQDIDKKVFQNTIDLKNNFDARFLV